MLKILQPENTKGGPLLVGVPKVPELQQIGEEDEEIRSYRFERFRVFAGVLYRCI